MFSEFVFRESFRLQIDDANRFVGAFHKIERYHSFLLVIVHRYKQPDGVFREVQEQRAMMAEDQVLFWASLDLADSTWLEIESFYIFAKILLDHVARGIECYFGLERRASLNGHSKLVKNFIAYSSGRGLTETTSFLEKARTLGDSITDVRDKLIIHERASHRIRGLSYGGGSVRGLADEMFTEHRRRFETEDLASLLSVIDEYLAELQVLIFKNQDRSILKAR